MKVGDWVLVLSGNIDDDEENGYHEFIVGDKVEVIKIDKYIHCRDSEGTIQKLEEKDIKAYGNKG